MRANPGALLLAAKHDSQSEVIVESKCGYSLPVAAPDWDSTALTTRRTRAIAALASDEPRRAHRSRYLDSCSCLVCPCAPAGLASDRSRLRRLVLLYRGPPVRCATRPHALARSPPFPLAIPPNLRSADRGCRGDRDCSGSSFHAADRACTQLGAGRRCPGLLHIGPRPVATENLQTSLRDTEGTPRCGDFHPRLRHPHMG